MNVRILGGLLALTLAACSAAVQDGSGSDYEVWAADQNGNVLYVLAPGGDLLREVDLSELVGADRPHTLHTDRDGRRMFFANTVSNQASVHRIPGAEPAAVVDDVGKSPHAVQPHPDDPARAYVSNIAPRARDGEGRPDRGETIAEIVRDADGRWSVARYLDLAAEPALADDERFPSRRPVLVAFGADGRHMLVTLFHGGVAVVDLDEWGVTRAWGTDHIRGHGTVAVPSPDRGEIYVTAGAEDVSSLHVFDASGEPELVASHDLSEWGSDAHGAAIHVALGELWLTHRASGTLTVHPLPAIRDSGEPAAVLDLQGETPDLIEIGSDGRRAYVTLRGPDPAPTIPFPLQGTTPGVAVVDVQARQLLRIVPLGDRERSDFHGVAIVSAGR